MRILYFIGISLVVILFTLLGIVVGVSLSNESKEALNIVKDYSALGSLITAIVTMFVAIFALGTWKTHFDHVEKFKAIIDLERELRIFFLSFDEYLTSYIDKVVHCNATGSYEVNKESYLNSRKQFMRSLDFANSFLSNRERTAIEKEHSQTLEVFNSAISMADSNHKNTRASEFDPIRYKKNNEINNQYESFKNELRCKRK